MTITITSILSDVKMTPRLVLGYEWSAQSRNVIHPLLGLTAIAVTLRRAPLRRGTMQLLFLEQAAALEAFYEHRTPTRFLYEDTDRPELTSSYVLDGKVGVQLDPETRDRWIVSVDYQGVEPIWVPL